MTGKGEMCSSFFFSCWNIGIPLSHLKTKQNKAVKGFSSVVCIVMGSSESVPSWCPSARLICESMMLSKVAWSKTWLTHRVPKSNLGSDLWPLNFCIVFEFTMLTIFSLSFLIVCVCVRVHVNMYVNVFGEWFLDYIDIQKLMPLFPSSFEKVVH